MRSSIPRLCARGGGWRFAGFSTPALSGQISRQPRYRRLQGGFPKRVEDGRRMGPLCSNPTREHVSARSSASFCDRSKAAQPLARSRFSAAGIALDAEAASRSATAICFATPESLSYADRRLRLLHWPEPTRQFYRRTDSPRLLPRGQGRPCRYLSSRTYSARSPPSARFGPGQRKPQGARSRTSPTAT